MKGLSVAIALVLGAALAMAGCRRRGDEERWWLEDEEELGEQELGLGEWELEERDGLVYEIDDYEPFTGTVDEQWLNGRQKHVETGYLDGLPYGKITEWEDYGFEQRRETELLDGEIISYREWDEYGNLIIEWFYW